MACDLRSRELAPIPFVAPPPGPSWSPARIDGLTPCADTAPWGTLKVERELRLFVGPGVDVAASKAHLEAAQRYWAKHGVVLRIDQTVRLLDVATFFPADVDVRARGRVTEEAPRPGAHPHDDGAALSRALSPLRTLLHRQYDPGAPHAINVLVATEIAARGTALGDHFDSFEGLALPAPAQAQSPSLLLDALGAGPRTPTVLVSWRATHPRGPAGLVVAHELGHLFGLEHRGGASNLMSPSRRTDCLPVLDDEQLLQLRSRAAPPG